MRKVLLIVRIAQWSTPLRLAFESEASRRLSPRGVFGGVAVGLGGSENSLPAAPPTGFGLVPGIVLFQSAEPQYAQRTGRVIGVVRSAVSRRTGRKAYRM